MFVIASSRYAFFPCISCSIPPTAPNVANHLQTSSGCSCSLSIFSFLLAPRMLFNSLPEARGDTPSFSLVRCPSFPASCFFFAMFTHECTNSILESLVLLAHLQGTRVPLYPCRVHSVFRCAFSSPIDGQWTTHNLRSGQLTSFFHLL
eukprot:RCo016766